MDVENLGLSIRLFCRNLLGSRVSATLEESLLRTRADYETRLQERDRTISDLREQLSLLQSKVDRYELVLLPLSSPAGGFFSPPRPARSDSISKAESEPRPLTWVEIQADHARQQQEEADAEAAATAKEH